MGRIGGQGVEEGGEELSCIWESRHLEMGFEWKRLYALILEIRKSTLS
jgi:hypothetical protein